MNIKQCGRNIALGLLVLCCLLVVSCDEGSTTKTVNKSQWDTTVITVVWLQPSEVNAKCQSLGVIDTKNAAACAAVSRKGCVIYAPQPKSFSDKEGLRRFGHEAWHCFGAMHRGGHT